MREPSRTNKPFATIIPKKTKFSKEAPMKNEKIVDAREKAITNILERLPAKSLMRFKLVNKSWHALICDPVFTESYHIHALARSDASFLLFYFLKQNLHTRAIFPTNIDAVCSTRLPVNILGNSMPCTKVVNGLICLSDDFDKSQVYVLNVTTGEQIDLPRNRLFSKGKGILRDQRDGFVDFKAFYFLGFDPLSKKYKLVNFQCIKTEKRDEKGCVLDRCFVLTFGKDEIWREIDFSRFRIGEETETVSLNGKIYWSCAMFDGYGGNWMPFFDVQQEMFFPLNLPVTGGGSVNSITEVGGNVIVMCQSRALYKLEGIVSGWGHWSRENLQPLIRREMKSFCSSVLIGGTNTGEIMAMTLSKPENAREKLLMQYGQHKMHKTTMFFGMETGKYRWEKVSLPDGLPAKATNSLVVFADAAASNHVENIICLKALFGRTARERQSSRLKQKRVADPVTLSEFTSTIMYNVNRSSGSSESSLASLRLKMKENI